MNFKNQNRLVIEPLGALQHVKSKEGEDNNAFLVALNWDELLNVMSVLTDPEFKLWQYILKWRGQGYYDFSPADLEVNFGWTDNSARKYKSGLESKGFLIKETDKRYKFIPYPEQTTAAAALQREKNRIKHESHAKK